MVVVETVVVEVVTVVVEVVTVVVDPAVVVVVITLADVVESPDAVVESHEAAQTLLQQDSPVSHRPIFRKLIENIKVCHLFYLDSITVVTGSS